MYVCMYVCMYVYMYIRMNLTERPASIRWYAEVACEVEVKAVSMDTLTF